MTSERKIVDSNVLRWENGADNYKGDRKKRRQNDDNVYRKDYVETKKIARVVDVHPVSLALKIIHAQSKLLHSVRRFDLVKS